MMAGHDVCSEFARIELDETRSRGADVAVTAGAWPCVMDRYSVIRRSPSLARVMAT